MFIARKLKQENICEYLLYMWQIEDLIRALKLDINLVSSQIIKPYPVSTEERQELQGWYESLIDMMHRENIQQQGHLQLNKNIIIDLNDMHQFILQARNDAAYAAKFYHILPFITQLRKQQNDYTIVDLEVCFNFMYGIMVLKMKKAIICKETQKAQEEITKFLILVAQNYKLYKSGELEKELNQ